MIKRQPYDSVTIVYEAEAPWGRGGLDAFNYLKFRDVLFDDKEFTIRDSDTLDFLSKHIERSEKQPLDKEYIGSVYLLLYNGHKIDTLTTTVWDRPLQFNNTTFKDDELVLYIIDLICARDSVWSAEKGNYYFNGKFHYLDREYFEKLFSLPSYEKPKHR